MIRIIIKTINLFSSTEMMFPKYGIVKIHFPIIAENFIFSQEKTINEDNIENNDNKDAAKENKKNKEELQKLLDQAVKEERYEDAAKYRDELDNLIE